MEKTESALAMHGMGRKVSNKAQPGYVYVPLFGGYMESDDELRKRINRDLDERFAQAEKEVTEYNSIAASNSPDGFSGGYKKHYTIDETHSFTAPSAEGGEPKEYFAHGAGGGAKQPLEAKGDSDNSGYAFPNSQDIWGGLTKREWFAGQALAGLLSRQNDECMVLGWTEMAYKIADAMLAGKDR